MADLTITSADKTSIASTHSEVTWGETIAEGDVVYTKASTGLLWKADCTTSLATATVTGIAISSGAVDVAGFVVTGGPITLGTTLTQGKIYVLSVTGKIAPIDDIAASDYLCVLGAAKTTAILDVDIKNFGWTKT